MAVTPRPQTDTTVAALLSQRKLARADRLTARRDVLPSGLPALDALLPFAGWERGALTELVGQGGKHSLALASLAAISRRHPVAYLAAATRPDAPWLAAAGADLAHCHVLLEPQPDALAWCVQQVVGSGQFPLVAWYASDWHSREPRVDPVTWRRLLGLVKAHRVACLVLLDDHPSLPNLARPCALRLAVTGAPDGTLHLHVRKNAGGPPGAQATLHARQLLEKAGTTETQSTPRAAHEEAGSLATPPTNPARQRGPKSQIANRKSQISHPNLLWLQHFAIQRLVQRLPELKGQPVALHDGRQRVVQCNAAASLHGVYVGMRAREATALLADLALFPATAVVESEEVLSDLGRKLLRFSPRVARWGDEELVVDLAPSAHLYGGPAALQARLHQEITAAGYTCRQAAADSLAAARLAVRLRDEGPCQRLGGRREAAFVRALAPRQLCTLPELAAAADDGRLFAFLGLRTVGDLLKRSPQVLGDLFRGDQRDLLLYARRSPLLARHLVWLREDQRLERTLVFEPPLGDWPLLLHHLAPIFADLQAALSRRRRQLTRLTLTLLTEAADEQTLPLDLARPTRDPHLLAALCRLKLDHCRLTRPLAECRVTVVESVAETPAARDLLAPRRTGNTACSSAELANRLDVRLGRPGTLFRLEPVDSLRPEHRSRVCPTEAGSSETPTTNPARQRGPKSQIANPQSQLPNLPILWLQEQAELPPSRTPNPEPRTPAFFEFERFDARRCTTVRHRYHMAAGQLLKELAPGRYRIMGLYD